MEKQNPEPDRKEMLGFFLGIMGMSLFSLIVLIFVIVFGLHPFGAAFIFGCAGGWALLKGSNYVD